MRKNNYLQQGIKQNNVLGSILTFSLLFSISGCMDSSVENISDNTNSVNQLSKQRIISYSQTVNNEAEYREGDYFISPMIKYSTLGNREDYTVSKINDDGVNYFVLDNVFDTYFKTMKLNLMYSSDNSKDMFNNIFGQWRTSYTSYLDFNIDYDNANIKSRLYDTPRDACESGFEDVKENLYRGLLKDADVVYDDTKNLCVVREEGKDVGEFNIWSKTTGIVGDYHYLSQSSGHTLVFSKTDDGKYIADDRGVKVELSQLENGLFEYVDADSVIKQYSSDGKLLKIIDEGQETELVYDDKYKIIAVNGPSETKLTYNYLDNEALDSIEFGGKKVLFSYDDKNFLASVDMVTDEVYNIDDNTNLEELDLENNETAELIVGQPLQYSLLKFTYNSNNLLSTVTREEIVEDNGSIAVPASVVEYYYDDLNRVVKTVEDDLFENRTYAPNMVVLNSDDNEPITHNISYISSKQSTKIVTTVDSDLAAQYNIDAQVIAIELEEEATSVDDNASIVTQGVGDKQTMNINFTYNEKGLVNKIQYNSVATGKKFVQLEYKTRYPKPTKILTNDNVSFFDYNEKGQMIKKTSLDFDKDMKLKANSITLNDVLTYANRVEQTYKYDENGFLSKIINDVDSTSYSYETDENGKTQKKMMVKEQSLLSDLLKKIAILKEEARNKNKKGWTYETGSIAVKDSNAQTVFVGGCGDTITGGVRGFAQKSEAIDKSYYLWSSYDKNYTGIKHKDKFIAIGHSFGGDSVAAASLKQLKSSDSPDLMITVDPIGTNKPRIDGAKHWIEIYAMAGTPHGGYYRLVWKSKKIGRGWFTIKIPYLVISWRKTMKWNSSDWIAFAGGKGTYSEYDPGNASPNQFLKISAHHGDFEYMLWKMEKDKENNNFSIMYDSDDDKYNKEERSYAKYPQLYRNYVLGAELY